MWIIPECWLAPGRRVFQEKWLARLLWCFHDHWLDSRVGVIPSAWLARLPWIFRVLRRAREQWAFQQQRLALAHWVILRARLAQLEWIFQGLRLNFLYQNRSAKASDARTACLDSLCPFSQPELGYIFSALYLSIALKNPTVS